MLRISTEILARSLDGDRRELGDIRDRIERYVCDFPSSAEFLGDIDRRIAALKADIADYCGELSPAMPLHDDRFPLRALAREVNA